MKGNKTNKCANTLMEEKLRLQRMKIENWNLIGDVIKKIIEDFGKLIGIIGIIITMLGNAGLITYNAMSNNKTEKILEIPEMSLSVIAPSAENLLPISTITIPDRNIHGHPINRDGHLIRKIKKELFNGTNIILLIFTIVFVVPLLKKNKKEKEMKNDASSNSITNKK
jgi:hypothetical protein